MVVMAVDRTVRSFVPPHRQGKPADIGIALSPISSCGIGLLGGLSHYHLQSEARANDCTSEVSIPAYGGSPEEVIRRELDRVHSIMEERVRLHF
jgi:hypothetical protein